MKQPTYWRGMYVNLFYDGEIHIMMLCTSKTPAGKLEKKCMKGIMKVSILFIKTVI
jgi:hypothetical protein